MAVAGAVVLGVLMLFSYDVIKIDWISFMEIQPSYRADGGAAAGAAAFHSGRGAGVASPIWVPPAIRWRRMPSSIARGTELFDINCTALPRRGRERKRARGAVPAEQEACGLDRARARSLSDGAIFMTISNGSCRACVPLNENLTVRERWDVVNYVRTLQEK